VLFRSPFLHKFAQASPSGYPGRYWFLAALFNGCRELRIGCTALVSGRKCDRGMWESRVQKCGGLGITSVVDETVLFSSQLIKNNENLLVVTSAQRVVCGTERR